MTSLWNDQDMVDLANGRAQLEDEVQWSLLFDKSLLDRIEQYCWAFHSELEYVLIPYFVMSAAVAGKETEVYSGLPKPGRTNIYLLVCGNPGSGKSCGFDLVVNNTTATLTKELGFVPVTNDISRTALLHELHEQTEKNRPFLIIASDEMGLSLNAESKESKEWEHKRLIYNNGFSGTDIVSERMISRSRTNKVIIKKPHISIIGMTQPKPMFEWIKTVSANDDGLLERYLIWIVSPSEKKIVVLGNEVELPEKWPTKCLTMLAQYHSAKHSRKYSISPELYEKIYEFEANSNKKQTASWNQYLQLLAAGKEEEARIFRRQSRTSTVRYTELVLRFALGIHLGFQSLQCFLSGSTSLDKVPTEISEKIVDVAIASVRRCMNQIKHFRSIGSKKSKEVRLCQTEGNVIEQREEVYDEVETKCVKQIPTVAPNNSTDPQVLLMEKLQRKIVTFPSPFFIPKVIYRYTKGSTASQVLELLHKASQIRGGKNYLGELQNVKTGCNPYKVFFRAPYHMVDQEILGKYEIKSKTQYENLLRIPTSTEDTNLRKVIENSGGNWDLFLSLCSKQQPLF